MLGIGCTVLSSLGRERVSATLTALAAAMAALACAMVVPRHAFGQGQLEATAWCMAAVLGVALVVCAALVVRIAGAFVPMASAARVAVALAITVAVGTRIPAVSRALAPVLAIALAGLYLSVLAASREIQRADAAWVSRALLRSRRT